MLSSAQQALSALIEPLGQDIWLIGYLKKTRQQTKADHEYSLYVSVYSWRVDCGLTFCIDADTLRECKQCGNTKSFNHTIITTRTAEWMAQMHQNMLYVPHCDKMNFWGRWLIGMTSWKNKYLQ